MGGRVFYRLPHCVPPDFNLFLRRAAGVRLDPQMIRLAFKGSQQMELNGAGDLVMRFGQEQIRLRRPTVYQGRKRTIEIGYLPPSVTAGRHGNQSGE
jgi:hypothetical protein